MLKSPGKIGQGSPRKILPIDDPRFELTIRCHLIVKGLQPELMRVQRGRLGDEDEREQEARDAHELDLSVADIPVVSFGYVNSSGALGRESVTSAGA